MDKLLAKIVSEFVDHPEDVKTQETTLEDGTILVSLSVNPEDMGIVIGKGGKIAKALRHLLRIPGIKLGKRVNLEILDQTS